MSITVRNGQGCERGGRRIALVGLLVTVLVLLLLWSTGTMAVLGEIRSILKDDETSLRSASGIATFCTKLQAYAQTEYVSVLLLVTVLYLWLQTFCIPGTVVLNAVVGAVLGTLVGVPYCTLLGTVGAASCYTLSRLVGTSLVEAADNRLMKGKGLTKIRGQVSKYKEDLLVYLLFLRLTPILPNWLVNLASPVVGVPLSTFAIATALGIVPQTYLSVRFGSLAHTGKPGEKKQIVSVWDTLLLAVIGAALVVGMRLKKKFAQEKEEDGKRKPHTGGLGSGHHPRGVGGTPPV